MRCFSTWGEDRQNQQGPAGAFRSTSCTMQQLQYENRIFSNFTSYTGAGPVLNYLLIKVAIQTKLRCKRMLASSVAVPESGAFLTPGSGRGKISGSGKGKISGSGIRIRDEQPGSYFGLK
jgi:hypothetical protein